MPVEIGGKYGRLTVVGLSHKNKWGQKMFKSVCECGNTSISVGYNLTSGNTKSCGCLMREISRELIKKVTDGNKLESGEARFRRMYRECTDSINKMLRQLKVLNTIVKEIL